MTSTRRTRKLTKGALKPLPAAEMFEVSHYNTEVLH
jgi:hypothetical protein